MSEKHLSLIKKTILQRRLQKHSGVGGILKHLRKQTAYHDWGDIPLLMEIVQTLRDQKIKFSKGEVYRAFQFIPLDDYSLKEKHQILKSLFGQEN